MKLTRAISVSLVAYFPFNVKPQVKVYELIMWDEQMTNMRGPWKNSG